MLSAALLALLAFVLCVPPLLLSRREGQMAWATRYFLSILPVAYTWLGWQFGSAGLDFFTCRGNFKGIHDCFLWGADFTPLVDHGLFLMIPCVFVALPMSLWLLLNTAARQMGAWHRKNWPDKAAHEE
ncbi:MAG: hypothetical protein HZC23_02335 [Rhodocyclales bacterium]|nr:hypothetical protein [Rhodocyclales bacterium]